MGAAKKVLMGNEGLYAASGPMLLLAGPGTGKTYSLARRIRHLVQVEGVPPDRITVITFTAAAASNMRSRISDESKPEVYLPYPMQPKVICTIHSLGYRVVREGAEQLGLTDPIRVVTEDEVRDVLMRDAAQLSGYGREAAHEPATCRQAGSCKPVEDPKCHICQTYRTLLKACNAVDYDDQVMLACQLLRTDASLLAAYRDVCTHLLVDEYQDINGAQYEFIRLLSGASPTGLFAVGDDDQSIYSWRGGSPSFIRAFRAHFGEAARVEPLQKSFRCHRNVLEAATAVVRAYDPDRLEKGPFTYKEEDGPKVLVHNAPSDAKEARLVASIVQGSLPAQDVLILVPQRSYAYAIVAELRARRIAFDAPGRSPGDGLPAIAILGKWLDDTSDSLSLRVCLEAMIDSPESGVPSPKSRKEEKLSARESAFGVIAELWTAVTTGATASLWQALELGSDSKPLLQHVHSSLTRLLRIRVADGDASEFLSDAVRSLAPWLRASDCLAEVSAWVAADEQLGRGGAPAESRVRIMTIQGAKGLEAQVVIIVGLEEGSVPRSDSASELPEQSRLLFVSMTRAIGELHLFHARKRSSAVAMRSIYQEGTPPGMKPSRFLASIPKENHERVYHKP